MSLTRCIFYLYQIWQNEYKRQTTKIILNNLSPQLAKWGMGYFVWNQIRSKLDPLFCQFWTLFHLFIKYLSSDLALTTQCRGKTSSSHSVSQKLWLHSIINEQTFNFHLLRWMDVFSGSPCALSTYWDLSSIQPSSGTYI